MLLSRRIFSDAHNHKLGTLVKHLNLTNSGNLHRALADAQVTAELLFRIQSEILIRYGVCLSHRDLSIIQKNTHKQY
ncbi:hypothetical protein WCLP8_5360004 [uncultured Gammaproteobacteria bacterium]